MRRLTWSAVRLPLVIGGLALLVAFALSWAAYREVRQATLAASEQRLENIAGELVNALQANIRSFQRTNQALAAEPAVRAWLRAPGPATAERARERLSAERGDSSDRAWQLISNSGDTLSISNVPPGRVPDSTGVSRIEAVGDTTHFAVTFVVEEAGRPIGRIVHWPRNYPDIRTRDQIASLGGGGALFRLGSEGGAWTDMAQRQQPLEPAGTTLTVTRDVTGSPWRIVLQRPESLVLAPARSFLARIIVIATLLSLLALAVAWWQGTRITAERMREENEARERSERQWRSVFSANPLPMWIVDVETWRFLAVNPAAVRHYGYSEAEFLAMKLDDIHPPEELPRLNLARAAAPNQPAALARVRHRRKDGSVIDVDLTSNAVDFGPHPARIALAQDVTQRLRLEAELRQAQKMEAVGRLAAGVAHDFNNVLAVIMNYAELLREEQPPHAAEPLEMIGEIVKAANHASTLTRQLLTFSRQQVTRPEVLELNALVRRMEGMMRPMLNARITLQLSLADSAGHVNVDPAQLEQVILNLVINAGDAMPEGGTLTVATGADDLGANAEIIVTDSGIGMTPEVQARIFDPFFSTKDETKGTGLGLPTAYGIVTQAGGSISVTSRPGEGSSFVIRLPRVAARGRKTPDGQTAPPHGTETVLLAEDEDAVRAAVTTILRRRGYTVLPAANPMEALAIAERHPGHLDLLLSDVVMPGMTGPALYARLRERRPDLKVLYMSGYAGDAVREHGLDDASVPFLEKPFSMAVLAEKVREALA